MTGRSTDPRCVLPSASPRLQGSISERAEKWERTSRRTRCSDFGRCCGVSMCGYRSQKRISRIHGDMFFISVGVLAHTSLSISLSQRRIRRKVGLKPCANRCANRISCWRVGAVPEFKGVAHFGAQDGAPRALDRSGRGEGRPRISWRPGVPHVRVQHPDAGRDR